jgi:hypothetical protein
MKQIFAILFAAALAISAADAPRVSRALMTSAEKSLDDRIVKMWNEPLALVGPTRGVYLPNYGIVFTAEMSLVVANTSLMNPVLTEADKAAVKRKKAERLPQLREALKKALADVAAMLDPVPVTDQVVIALILPRYAWEEDPAIPLQITAQATRQQLLNARSNAAALSQVVKLTESF